MTDTVKFKKIFYDKYKKIGYKSFYEYILNYCISKISLIENSKYKGIYPHIEMIKYHDMAMKIFRIENSNDLILIRLAKLFRKIAHKVYRIMLKKNLIEPTYQFLTEVKAA